MRIYVDTNVFIDFLENRNNVTFDFFLRTISCEFTLIISDLVLFELQKQKFDFVALHSWLGKKICIEKVIDLDKKLAQELPTHMADAIHAAVSLRLDVDIFLSQDKGFSFLLNHRKIDEI